VLATISDKKLARDGVYELTSASTADYSYNYATGVFDYTPGSGNYNQLTAPDNIVDYYVTDMLSTNDYYPFGMIMPGRSFSPGEYRFGFNGKEKDDEWTGSTGATYDYGFRIYDSRIARFLSVDPLTKSFPMLTPYQFASNTPIQAIDLDGLEAVHSYLVYNEENKGYELVCQVVDDTEVHYTLTAHFIGGPMDGKSKVAMKEFKWGRLLTYFDDRGFIIYGSASSNADSPGRPAKEVWGSFDFAAFNEAMGLILTGMKSKGENSVKKEFTGTEFEKLVDNVKSTAEYIQQNPDATDDEKKDAVSNIETVSGGEMSIKNLHDCETCTNLYFEDGTQVQESDTTGKDYKVTGTTTESTGHKGVKKVKVKD